MNTHTVKAAVTTINPSEIKLIANTGTNVKDTIQVTGESGKSFGGNFTNSTANVVVKYDGITEKTEVAGISMESGKIDIKLPRILSKDDKVSSITIKNVGGLTYDSKPLKSGDTIVVTSLNLSNFM